MSTYVRGDSVRIETEVWDPTTIAETAVTPSSIVIVIYNPNGNAVVTDAAMTAMTGGYFYEYASAVGALVGIYTYRISAVVTTKTGRIKGSFTLERETDV